MQDISSEKSVQERVDGSHEDDIDLLELWREVWSAKWLITILSIVVSCLAAFYALQIPNEYKSTAILTPTANAGGNSAISGIASQFGGLASLAGVNLGASGKGDKAAIAIEIMKTWGFLENFIRKNDLEVEVYAVSHWVREENKLVINEDVYDVDGSSWVVEIDSGMDGVTEPTSWQLFQAIQGRIDVTQDAKTGLVQLSVTHFSPVVAKKWVDLLVMEVNEHAKQQDLADATSSINYLEKQIEGTAIAEMRAIFYQLIEEQTKKLMLAEISDEYILKTLSEAKIPEEKTKPKRAIIVLLGGILGALAVTLFVVFRYLIRSGSKLAG